MWTEDKLRSFLGQKRLMDGEIVTCVGVEYEVVLEWRNKTIKHPFVTYWGKDLIACECMASTWDILPLAQ